MKAMKLVPYVVSLFVLGICGCSHKGSGDSPSGEEPNPANAGNSGIGGNSSQSTGGRGSMGGSPASGGQAYSLGGTAQNAGGAQSSASAGAAVIDISGVTVHPATTDLKPSSSFTFVARIGGIASTEVTWAVQENNGGTISDVGTYVAPSQTGTFHVVAKSKKNTASTGTAVVNVSADVIIPTDRTTLWNPGLNAGGGIRDRQTNCATLSPSGGDDTLAIRTAIEKCADGQVVKLGAGTFKVSGDGVEILRSNITLRGAGPQQTLLNKTDETGDNAAHMPVLTIGGKWLKRTVGRPGRARRRSQ
jgi:hypothetical protein